MVIGLAIICGIGVLIFFLGLSLQPSSMNTGDLVEQRLMTYGGGTTDRPLTIEEAELQRPFSERFMRPGIERLGKFLGDRTSAKAKQDLTNRLNLAGRPANLTPEGFQAVRYVACLAMFGVGLLLGALIHGPIAIGIGALVGAVIGFYFPVLWLKQKVDGRRKEIQVALPDAMDLLTIAVEAGLGFDAAMSRVTDKFNNALSDEFSQVLQETRLGRPRLEALDDMGRRTGVEDLHNFCQAVIQSEQMGVGVAKIMRIQSDEMRRKRRQRAQEKAAQATLKMLLPMVGCIFPTLWIVLLGPAVLILMKVKT
jgi:tight adherence protein C